MPIYEFLCGSCRKKFSVLCKICERDEKHACQHCGEKEGRRLVSRFKTIRSEEQLMESLADPSALAGLDENDPSTFTTWAKKMAREMGENMDDEIEAMAQEEFDKSGEPGHEPPMGGFGADDDQL